MNENYNENDKKERIKNVVKMYFLAKELQNLMEYGSDYDRLVMLSLTDLYKDILDKLGLKCIDIYTNEISDGKYETYLELINNATMVINTSAWNDEKVVIDNVISIQETVDNMKDKNLEDDMEM